MPSLDQRVSEVEAAVRALVDGEERRNAYAKQQLDDALERAKQIFSQRASSTDIKLDEVLRHSQAASDERKRRVAEEDARKQSELDALEKKVKDDREWRLKLLGLAVTVIVAIVGAFAASAGVSHVTEGPHGAGTEK